MNRDKSSVLQEIYDTCLKNRIEEKENFQKTIDRLSEIEIHLSSMKENEEFDLNVFSPRKPENLYKDYVSKYESEKEELEYKKRE